MKRTIAVSFLGVVLIMCAAFARSGTDFPIPNPGFSQSAYRNTVATADAEAPVSSSWWCGGIVDGTITDLPNIDLLRSNLASVELDANVSVNYTLSYDPITPGVTSSVRFRLEPIDFLKPSIGRVTFRDAKGNSRTEVFSYTPRLLALPAQVLWDSLATNKSYSFLVPVVNTSPDTIRVYGVQLEVSPSEFTLTGGTQEVLMRSGDTLWVRVGFSATASRQFQNTIFIQRGCSPANRQKVVVTARTGLLKFDIGSIDFGTRDIGSTTTRDVTATNTGTIPVTLTDLLLKDKTVGFIMKNRATLPLQIAAGASVKVGEVDFSPARDGALKDSIGYDVAEDNLAIIYEPIVTGNGMIVTSVSDRNGSECILAPNPAFHFVRINIPDGQDKECNAELFDVNGSRVAGVQRDGSSMMFFQSVPSGVYVCRVHCGTSVWVRELLIAQ